MEVPSALAACLASELDNGGYQFCSRLSAEVFGVILQTILQAEYTLDGERGLHLLAVSATTIQCYPTNTSRVPSTTIQPPREKHFWEESLQLESTCCNC